MMANELSSFVHINPLVAMALDLSVPAWDSISLSDTKGILKVSFNSGRRQTFF